jgi:hypothetical protein
VITGFSNSLSSDFVCKVDAAHANNSDLSRLPYSYFGVLGFHAEIAAITTSGCDEQVSTTIIETNFIKYLYVATCQRQSKLVDLSRFGPFKKLRLLAL